MTEAPIRLRGIRVIRHPSPHLEHAVPLGGLPALFFVEPMHDSRVDGFGAAEAEGRSHGVEAADQVRVHGKPHGDGVCVSQHVSALNTRSGMGPILECYRTEIPGALPPRGYNPHQRKVPSYYPIMAHLAETTHILRVKNRSGNVHDGKAGLPFLRALWPQLVGLRTGGARLRFRMDGAFFRQDVLRWLQGRGVGYAINVPFYRWLDLQRYIRDSPTWVPVAPGVTGFAVPGAETPWHIPVTVTIYRKKVPRRGPARACVRPRRPAPSPRGPRSRAGSYEAEG